MASSTTPRSPSRPASTGPSCTTRVCHVHNRLVALILAGLAFGAGESELGGSFTDISNIKVQRLYGFFAFRQDYWKATDKDWRRRLSSDFGRTRSPSISRATLARIPVKPTTQSRERKAAPPRRP